MRHIPTQLLYHQSRAPNTHITSVYSKPRPHHVAWVTASTFPPLHVICIFCWAQHSFIFWRKLFGLCSLSHTFRTICVIIMLQFILLYSKPPFRILQVTSHHFRHTAMCHFSLIVLAKQLRKATATTSCLSVCPSIWTEQLPQSGFSLNFVIDIFSKVCWHT
jgi:hypothetical protein